LSVFLDRSFFQYLLFKKQYSTYSCLSLSFSFSFSINQPKRQVMQIIFESSDPQATELRTLTERRVR